MPRTLKGPFIVDIELARRGTMFADLLSENYAACLGGAKRLSSTP